MQKFEEQRIQDLEQIVDRGKSLPYTLLFVVFGIVLSALIQYKINDRLNQKIITLQRTVEMMNHEK